MIGKIQIYWSIAVFVVLLCSADVRGELLAHWEFEKGAPFDDAASSLHLSVESSDPTGKATFTIVPGKPAAHVKGKTAMAGKLRAGVDLRLRVNAPTRGGNPFRLSENSWTISGWLLHPGETPSKFGNVVAGTNGYSKLEGRGFAGWSLRAVAEGEEAVKLAAKFSTGGEKPVVFEVKGAAPITTGETAWHHFGLAWDGASRKARLFIDGKLAGEGVLPENFDLAVADRNAFRGIWIAGRPTSKDGQGSDHWVGRLDEVKFETEAVADEAAMLAAFEPSKPKPKPKPVAPVVAKGKGAGKGKGKAAPPAPKPPPPPKPTEKVLEVRTWTDLRGKTMEAAMVVPLTPVAGRVLLQSEDGIRVSVLLERLSEGDGAYVGGQ